MLVPKEICAVGLRHVGGGGQLWPCRKWGKKTRKSKVAEASHVNKEEVTGVRRALRL